MIKNIIFDLAGVVINLDIIRDTEALNSVGLPNFYEFHKHPEILNPTILYLDGLMNEKDFLDAIRPHCKPGCTDEEILWSMDAVIDVIPKSRLEMIKSLKTHYKVYLLSNIYVRGWKIALEQFAANGFTTEDCFDKLFLSYEMQMHKPDACIFEALIKDTCINPDETIYFDDSKANIEAATKLGIHSYLVPLNKLEQCIEQNKIDLCK